MAKERKIDMVILGLLSHEDLTGYDIKKRIDGAISFFWKGSFGNIYPALKDMETQGLIIKNQYFSYACQIFIICFSYHFCPSYTLLSFSIFFALLHHFRYASYVSIPKSTVR